MTGKKQSRPADVGMGQTVASSATPTQPKNPLTQSQALQRSAVLPRIRTRTEPPELPGTDEPRYRRMRPLGEGGMGEVVLVRDTDIGRQVALKSLKPDPEGGGESLVRFVDEIRIIGQLEHPGIVPIHDVGVDEEGRYFFVMKYLEGETLEEIIAKLAARDPAYVERYTFEHRTQIFLQILHAVHFAHARGFLHRDIKPSNVMVGRFGEVMVMDWGLAKAVQRDGSPEAADAAEAASRPTLVLAAAAGDDASVTRNGTLLGTPAYMSPEQVRGENDSLDERSDIYSLCVMFHELLTLNYYLPLKETIRDMLMSILKDPPENAILLHHKYGVPPELAWFVLRGLAKDPEQRYQSVAEMIQRLMALEAGNIPVQCPCTGMKSMGSRFSRFIDRHPNLSIMTFVATGLCSLYGGLNLLMHLGHLVTGR